MTDLRFDVLCIGNAIVDVIADADDSFLQEQGLDKGSMRLIDEAEAVRLYGQMGPGREVSGGSAGGHLALMVGMMRRSAKLGPRTRMRAVVNFYGITDVADQLGGPNERKYAVTWLPEQERRLSLATRVSPMTYVRKGLPPILTIHGDADQTVPYEQGVRLTKALRDAGSTAELVNVPQGGHGFPKEVVDRIYERNIWPFLKRHGVM
jgi:dipeptidyl aminopeptidase/acylaminoacyl peptidase